jgi:hypothetical protein
MEPNSGENLPRFEFEKTPKTPEGLERQRERAMEQPRPVTETKPDKQQPQTVTDHPAAPPIPIPVTDATVPRDTSVAGAKSATSDLAAHETDRIEKQWVTRAKAIVHQTQDDPYVQKKEMSKAGADYIKKRFNKTIPTDDSAKA